MLQQDQLVNCWHSATDRPNILVVGSGDAIYVTSAMGLRTGDQPCEVVCLDKFADAMRLLRRGSIAVVVLPESPALEGGLELILEGLGKDRPPRFVIAGGNVSKSDQLYSPLLRLSSNAPASIRESILMAAADYERNAANHLSVRMLLEATAGFPEQVWLKVCNEDGDISDLCLNGGKIVYAECGKLIGTAAADKVLSWTNCLYESRELPAFLQSNMNCWLRELSRLHQADQQVDPPKQDDPPPAPVAPIEEFEEPTELTTLDSIAEPVEAETVVQPEAVAPPQSVLPDEPTEPNFDLQASDDEISVEEPLDMVLESDDDSLQAAEPEEPEQFEFDGATQFDMPSHGIEEYREPVFAAVAVIAEGSSHLENCQPEAEAVFFDTLAIRDIFDLSIRCAQRQQIGAPKWVEISGERGGIAIAPIPGTRRLVAVRLRHGFGSNEQRELERLQVSLEHSCSLA
jgi:hypothetical protein